MKQSLYFRARPNRSDALLMAVGIALGGLTALLLLAFGGGKFDPLLLPLLVITGGLVGFVTALLVAAATWLTTAVAYSADSKSARTGFAFLGALVGVSGASVIFLIRQGTFPPILVVILPTLVAGVLQTISLRRSLRAGTTEGSVGTTVERPRRTYLSICVALGLIVSLGIQWWFAWFDVPGAKGQGDLSQMWPKLDEDHVTDLATRVAVVILSAVVVAIFLLRPNRFKLPTVGTASASVAAAAFAFGWPMIQFGYWAAPIYDVAIDLNPRGALSNAYVELPLLGWSVLTAGLVAHLIGLRRMRSRLPGEPIVDRPTEQTTTQFK